MYIFTYEKWNELNIIQLYISYTKIIFNGPSMSTNVGQKNMENEVSEFEGSLLARSPRVQEPRPHSCLGCSRIFCCTTLIYSMGQRHRWVCRKFRTPNSPPLGQCFKKKLGLLYLLIYFVTPDYQITLQYSTLLWLNNILSCIVRPFCRVQL